MLFLVLLLANFCKSCVVPAGLGSGKGEIDYGSVLASSARGQLFASNNHIQDEMEPTILFRFNLYSHITRFNIRQPYSPISNDFFSREDVSNNRRYCLNINTTYLEQHETITFLYHIYFNRILYYPSIISDVNEIMSTNNLIPNICNNNNFDCSDISTPWGLAYTVSDELFKFSYFDGFNADGSYNREYNRIPFSDFRKRPYIPQNNPWILRQRDKWQPLLETDNLGFLFNQEHVVPHVGFTGRLYFTPDDYFCSLSSPDPKYDYELEARLVLERLVNLTDLQKAEIELFDNKEGSLNPLQQQWSRKSGFSGTTKTRLARTVFFATVYEASVLVWREKVKHDLIRPSTVIHDRLKGETITSYAGTDALGNSFGTQTFLADDWEPYIRTMPHSEYPSGSACVCKAYAQAMIRATGYDSFDGQFEGGLTLEFPAFSSSVEPKSTPKENLTLVFNSWSEISQRCSQSRLNGGMHFTASIKAGEDLCENIGNIVFEALNATIHGIKPEYVIDFNDRRIIKDRCNDFKQQKKDKNSKSRNGRGRNSDSSVSST